MADAREVVQTEAGDMVVELRGDRLIIDIPMKKVPQESHSQRHLIVAGTNGNVLTPIKTDEGRAITVNLNCFIVPEA